MENNRKLLFFDIDKTLLTPYPWTVPDSAKQALKEARYNGHLLFINSGRTYTMIPEIIKEMGFDGYVCGCGSQIYMNEELLFSSSIPNPLCRKTTELLRECRIPAFFERPDKILYDSSSRAVLHLTSFWLFRLLILIWKLSANLQMNIFCVSYMKTRPGN